MQQRLKHMGRSYQSEEAARRKQPYSHGQFTPGAIASTWSLVTNRALKQGNLQFRPAIRYAAQMNSEKKMNSSQILTRSPELMSRADTALLVVDVQTKLISLVPGHDHLVWNIRRLIDGAKVLGLPVLGSEQYPQGLGPTVPRLAALIGPMPAKVDFSCAGCPEIAPALDAAGIHKVLVVGIEAHVCVQQTVLDLIAASFRVYVVVDAVGSRFDIDYQTALRRMESSGATLTTTEAALFEWCQRAGTPEFKQISALVRESGPGA